MRRLLSILLILLVANGSVGTAFAAAATCCKPKESAPAMKMAHCDGMEDMSAGDESSSEQAMFMSGSGLQGCPMGSCCTKSLRRHVVLPSQASSNHVTLVQVEVSATPAAIVIHAPYYQVPERSPPPTR